MIEIATRWEYDGEKDVMTIYHRDGEVALRLPMSIPDAHALMRFIDGEKKNAGRVAREELFDRIANLAGDYF